MSACDIAPVSSPNASASSGGRNPVSPVEEEIVETEGEEAEEAEDEDVLKLKEEVGRKAVVEDKRELRKLGDARKPSTEEVEEHELTHIPYRNWCSVCVRCRGKDLDHRKAVDEERGVSEYAFDYCFPGDEFGYKLVVLAGREKGHWHVLRICCASQRIDGTLRD